jgi:hypothetical protein
MRPLICLDNLKEISVLPKVDGQHKAIYPRLRIVVELTHTNKNKINLEAVYWLKRIIQTLLLYRDLRLIWITFMPRVIKEKNLQWPRRKSKLLHKKNTLQMKID